MSMENDFDGMGDLAEESVRATNARFSNEEMALIRRTSTDLKRFRPQVKDSEAFDKLIAAVELSNKKNESIAEFQSRISALGPRVLSVVGNLVRFVATGRL